VDSPLEKAPIKAPEAKGSVQEPSIPIAVASEMEKLEKESSLLRRSLTEMQDINRLIIVVVFIGFLTLLFALAGLIIDTIRSHSDGNTQIVEELKKIEAQQQAVIDKQSPTPSPTSSAKQ
jgi:hypothetical protein